MEDTYGADEEVVSPAAAAACLRPVSDSDTKRMSMMDVQFRRVHLIHAVCLSCHLAANEGLIFIAGIFCL